MEEFVSLCIVTYNGLIKIPFRSLQELDLFTVRYRDENELINGFNELLKLTISSRDVINIYVYHEYQVGKNEDNFRDSYVPVKYKDDNYDLASLKDAFIYYLQQDHNRVRDFGVRKIRTSAMREFMLGNEDLSNFDIKVAVDKYFEGAKYGIFRNVYFKLKKRKVKVGKNRVKREEDKMMDRNLSRFSSDNEFYQHLLEYASRGPEESDKVVEELSKFDLEELSIRLKNPHFGLFDGVIKNTDVSLDEVNGLTQSKLDIFLEDLYDLEKYTGYDIDELMEYVSGKGHRK